MENKVTNIFEKILYGQKICNDNIVILNDKIDAIIKMLSVVEEAEPNTAGATKE
nr:MAG TPA: hypothetical protein [Caudoviricetes sp.]